MLINFIVKDVGSVVFKAFDPFYVRCANDELRVGGYMTQIKIQTGSWHRQDVPQNRLFMIDCEKQRKLNLIQLHIQETGTYKSLF